MLGIEVPQRKAYRALPLHKLAGYRSANICSLESYRYTNLLGIEMPQRKA
jgi:hypothetical protein